MLQPEFKLGQVNSKDCIFCIFWLSFSTVVRHRTGTQTLEREIRALGPKEFIATSKTGMWPERDRKIVVRYEVVHHLEEAERWPLHTFQFLSDFPPSILPGKALRSPWGPQSEDTPFPAGWLPLLDSAPCCPVIDVGDSHSTPLNLWTFCELPRPSRNRQVTVRVEFRSRTAPICPQSWASYTASQRGS